MLQPRQHIGPPKQKILTSLHQLYYLRADQIADKDFSPSSISYVRHHLRELQEEGYITGKRLYKGGPFVFTLDRKGRNFLRDQGLILPRNMKKINLGVETNQYLLHTLTINTFIIKALSLERQGAFQIAEYRHDIDMKTDPLLSNIPGIEQPVRLIPDCWLDIRTNYQYGLCVEINLSAVERKRWQRKVLSYLNCLPSYIQKMGTDTIQVIVINNLPFNSDKYTSDLIRWTESVLTRQNQVQDADLFLFSDISITETPADELFNAPHFRMPFSQHPVALIT